MAAASVVVGAPRSDNPEVNNGLMTVFRDVLQGLPMQSAACPKLKELLIYRLFVWAVLGRGAVEGAAEIDEARHTFQQLYPHSLDGGAESLQIPPLETIIPNALNNGDYPVLRLLQPLGVVSMENWIDLVIAAARGGYGVPLDEVLRQPKKYCLDPEKLQQLISVIVHSKRVPCLLKMMDYFLMSGYRREALIGFATVAAEGGEIELLKAALEEPDFVPVLGAYRFLAFRAAECGQVGCLEMLLGHPKIAPEFEGDEGGYRFGLLLPEAAKCRSKRSGECIRFLLSRPECNRIREDGTGSYPAAIDRALRSGDEGALGALLEDQRFSQIPLEGLGAFFSIARLVRTAVKESKSPNCFSLFLNHLKEKEIELPAALIKELREFIAREQPPCGPAFLEFYPSLRTEE